MSTLDPNHPTTASERDHERDHEHDHPTVSATASAALKERLLGFLYVGTPKTHGQPPVRPPRGDQLCEWRPVQTSEF